MANELMEKMNVNYEVNGEAVKLTGPMVKSYLVRGNGNVSDQELVMFVNLCKYQKLNPFLNEAYLIKFGQQPASIVVSKEAFMKRAESHAKYEGFQAGIIVEREGELVEIEGAVKLPKDNLIGGWCKVYRSDRKMPITSKISLEEFDKKQSTWKQMPLTMIRKTAIVNGLREAFPESLNALYTEEEVQEHPMKEVNVEQEIKQNANTEVLDIQPEQPKKHDEPPQPMNGAPSQEDPFADVQQSFEDSEMTRQPGF